MVEDFTASTRACVDIALASDIKKSLLTLKALTVIATEFVRNDSHLQNYTVDQITQAMLQDVDLTGRIAALANNKVLALYDLDRVKSPPDFITHKTELPSNAVTAITWNRHHNRRNHLASTKGSDVMIWNTEDTGKPAMATLRKHKTAVTEISWSPTEEDLLASASNSSEASSSSIYIWDVRCPSQSPAQELNRSVVQEFNNPVNELNTQTKGARLTQVKFNRKKSHLLASAFGTQICMWDTRKAALPVLRFPAHHPMVTTLDWSYESEYGLLTGGGDACIKLWSVRMANEEQRGDPELKGSSQREQPVQRVMFTPFGQGGMTSCRGMWENEKASQTLQLWSFAPGSVFQLVTTFEVGTARILGSCWKKTDDGLYQVVSLDTDDHLRVHNVDASHRRACGDLPVDGSPASRDFGATVGSEMVEAPSSKISVLDLKRDLVPVVWKLSMLQGVSTDRMTGQITSKELAQVEAFAKGGDFGHVTDTRIDVTRNSFSLTMHASAAATSPSRNESLSRSLATDNELSDVTDGGSRRERRVLAGGVEGQGGDRNPTVLTSVTITGRLCVVLNVPPGYHSRGELAQIRLRSGGTSRNSGTINYEDPLNTTTMMRLRERAEDAMRQAPRFNQHRLKAGLLQLKEDLAAHVRDVANKVTGLVSGLAGEEQLPHLQFGLDSNAHPDLPESSWGARDMSEPFSGTNPSCRKESIVPCPRRFGATFSPNGTLVVFSSAQMALRVRMGDGSRLGSSSLGPDTNRDMMDAKQATSTYPRTYEDLMACLLKDSRDNSEDEGLQEPNLFSATPWRYVGLDASSRPIWRDPSRGGHDDDNSDLELYSSEGSSGGEGDETCAHPTSRVIGQDPDAFFGQPGGSHATDDEEKADTDQTARTDETEARLPWTPSPNKVILLDLSWLLPGSPSLAGTYALGPSHPLPCLRDSSLQRRAVPKSVWGHNSFFSGSGTSSSEADLGTNADLHSSNSQRRHTVLPRGSLGIAGGVPPPPVLRRDISAPTDSSGRNVVISVRINGDSPQPTFGQQKLPDSSPALRGRSVGYSSRGLSNSTGSSSGLAVAAGFPAFVVGSPGRWDTVTGVQRVGQRSGSIDELIVGSPHQHQMALALSDVMELPLQKPGMNLTPPRHHPFLEEPSAALAAPTPGGGGGPLSPGTTLSLKSSGEGRTWPRMRSGSGTGGSKWLAGAGMRQSYHLRRTPSGGSGPSPPIETPRARIGFPPPSSPAATAIAPSGSPPMSDFGLLPGPQSAERGRGASFSAGGGTPLSSKEFFATEGSVTGHLGRTGRGSTPIGLGDHVISLERPVSAPHPSQRAAPHVGAESVQSSGTKSRSGTGLWYGGVASGNDNGTATVGLHSPSVGELCRRNAVIAEATGGIAACRTWLLLAVTADAMTLEAQCDDPLGQRTPGGGARCGTIKEIIRLYEALGDTQMLATMVCVLSSASLGSGMGLLLPQEEEFVLKYELYLVAYAELLYLWRLDQTRLIVLSHLDALKDRRPDVLVPPIRAPSQSMLEESFGDQPSEVLCMVCPNKVVAEGWVCSRCGHGGHASHIKEHFAHNSQCVVCGCTCREYNRIPSLQ